MKRLKKFNENIDYKKILTDIDNKKVGYKYYVGYINLKDSPSSWVHDGRFKGFLTHEDTLEFIKKLEDEGIKPIIFTPDQYNEIINTRNKGD